MYVHVNSLNSHESSAKSTVRFRNFTRIGSIRTVLRLRLQIYSVKRKLGKVSTKAFLEHFLPRNQQDSKHCSSSSKRKCLQKAAFNFQRVLCTSKMAGISLIFLDGRGGEEGGTGNIRGRQAGRVWDKGSRSSHSLSHPESPFPTNTADVTSRENVLFLFVIYDFHLKKGQFVFFFFNF